MISEPGSVSAALTLRTAHRWDGSPADPGEICTVHLRRDGADFLVEVDAPYHGDPAPEGPPGPRWALWEHEVVELFVLGDHQRYTEVELSPHGHHLVLRLDGVRNAVARELPLAFTATIHGSRWTGEARLPAELLPPPPWRVNAVAIHGVGEGRRYLTHTPLPGEKPDFHRVHLFEVAWG